MSSQGANLRESLEKSIEGVEGWLHPAEAWELHEASRRASHLTNPIVVEIGSWKGRSTIALALGLRSESKGTVFAIDPMIPAPDDPPDGPDRRFAELIGNLERAGIRDLVQPLRMTSHAARPRFQRSSVSVLFIDGDHEYAGVLQDIDDWSTSLVHGALVAFNDPFLSGVRRALLERAGRRGTPFRRPRFVVNSIFFEFRPEDPWTTKDSNMCLRLRALLHAGRAARRVLEHPRLPRLMARPIQRTTEAVVPRILPNNMGPGRATM